MGQILQRLMEVFYTKKLDIVVIGLENRLVVHYVTPYFVPKKFMEKNIPSVVIGVALMSIIKHTYVISTSFLSFSTFIFGFYFLSFFF